MSPAAVGRAAAVAALGAVAVGGALALPSRVAAQSSPFGYRAVIGGRLQSVSFRGWESDSALASTVVVGSTGGFFTNDGIAASCPGGNSFCYFFRPGDRRNATPVASTADLTMWGLGVPGLSLHAKMRAQADAGGVDWAGTVPGAQLFEAYAEYARRALTARLGRQTLVSRLGIAGFDGGRATMRFAAGQAEASAYGGFGFARATALGLSNAVTAPLGDFLPPERHLIGGALVGWSSSVVDGRLEYQREVDRSSDKLLSERTALSATLRPTARWSVTGGAEYDIAQGVWGTADLSLRYATSRIAVTGAARRYRPHFDLSTIWAAFAPAAHEGLYGSVVVTPVEGLQVRGRLEGFRFEQGGGDSPLVRAEREGWRWAAGATVTRVRDWTFEGGYNIEFGPGAGGRGFDGAVSWRPSETMALRLHGAELNRPLEFRFNDARVRWGGLEAEVNVMRQLAIAGGAIYLREDRRRPDAAAFSWDQLRLQARVTLVLEQGGADRLPLPRATRRTPSSIRFGQ